MAREYYNRTKSKEDPLEVMSLKLPKSVIAGLHKIGEHRQRFATFVAREFLTADVADELRKLNLDDEVRPRRKAS